MNSNIHSIEISHFILHPCQESVNSYPKNQTITAQFQNDLKKILGAHEEKIVRKLGRFVYPRLREQPYFGKNVGKLKGYKPETWRYRVGDYRFFYEIDDKKRIVFMIAADLRSKIYKR